MRLYWETENYRENTWQGIEGEIRGPGVMREKKKWLGHCAICSVKWGEMIAE